MHLTNDAKKHVLIIEKKILIKTDDLFIDNYSSIMMTLSNGSIFHVTGHLCGNSPVLGEFPAQRPVTRSFDVCFDLRLNKRLSKESWSWWFETLSCPSWRHCNDKFPFNLTLQNSVKCRLSFQRSIYCQQWVTHRPIMCSLQKNFAWHTEWRLSNYRRLANNDTSLGFCVNENGKFVGFGIRKKMRAAASLELYL